MLLVLQNIVFSHPEQFLGRPISNNLLIASAIGRDARNSLRYGFCTFITFRNSSSKHTLFIQNFILGH